jgi:hypothetical protein
VTNSEPTSVSYGEFSARLPAGADNVIATTIHSGAEVPRRIAHNDPPPHRDPASRCARQADPDPRNDPAVRAPLALTFGRAVSGDDYETVAQTPGVNAPALVLDALPHPRKVFVGDDDAVVAARRRCARSPTRTGPSSSSSPPLCSWT